MQFKECPGRGMIALGPQKEVDGVAALVDRAVQVLPLAADLDVGLVHPPALFDGALALAEHSCQDWQHLDGPVKQRGVIDENCALGHHLLDLAKTQWISGVPPNAHQHHLQRLVQPLNQAAQRLDHLHAVKLHRLTLPALA